VNQNVSLDGELGFVTNQPGYLLYRTRPGREATRYRGQPGITERRAHSIIADLAEAGYVITQRRPPQSQPGRLSVMICACYGCGHHLVSRGKMQRGDFRDWHAAEDNREFVQAA
jgi:hypothetical protein